MVETTYSSVDRDAADAELAARVVRHLCNNPLQRFSEPMLARRFAVPASTLRRAIKPALAGATVATVLVDSIRFYFSPRSSPCAAGRIVGKGELKGYETAIRRACELRMEPRGAGWRL